MKLQLTLLPFYSHQKLSEPILKIKESKISQEGQILLKRKKNQQHHEPSPNGQISQKTKF